MRIDRRTFAGHLAIGSSAAMGFLTSPLVATADDKKADDPKQNAQPEAEKPEVEKKVAAPPPQELLLLTLLTQRYPSEHYGDVALQGIYRDIQGDLARGRVLSEFPLKNSDEPSFVFRVYRGNE